MLLKNEDAKGKKDFIKVRGWTQLGGHSPFLSHFGHVISCKKKKKGKAYPCSNQNQTQEVLSNNAQHSINPWKHSPLPAWVANLRVNSFRNFCSERTTSVSFLWNLDLVDSRLWITKGSEISCRGWPDHFFWEVGKSYVIVLLFKPNDIKI